MTMPRTHYAIRENTKPLLNKNAPETGTYPQVPY